MFRVARLLVAATLTLAIAGPASAASTLAPLFTVPGVINSGPLGTFFACTNTDVAALTVGVEVVSQNGTQLVAAASNAVNLSPQSTELFSTTNALGFAVDVNLNPGVVTKGSANIWTTGKKVVCSAFLADDINNPPTSMVTLTIVRKGKQKGD